MRGTPLRLALVGLGTWASQCHLPVYAGARLKPHVHIVGLCSRDTEKAEAWAATIPGCRGYGSFDRMLGEACPNIVAVTTPDPYHTKYVLASLDADCDVLVEKPLATDLEECRAIVAASHKSGRRVLTLYHKRSDPLWAEASARIRSGSYGVLQMGWASIQNPVTVPAGGYFASGGEHTDPNWFLGSHFYDLLRFMTGENPVQVSARSYSGCLQALGVEAPDAFKADFVFTGGGSVSVLVSWNLPATAPSLTKQAMVLHFENGELDLNGTARGFVEHGAQGYTLANPYFLRHTAGGPRGYGAEYLEAAVMDLVGHSSSEIVLADMDDAWWASAMASAVDKAARTGEQVEVLAPPNGLS